MSEIQNIVNKYLNEFPIDIEKAKEKFKNDNRFKFLDDKGHPKYTWGVKSRKLYVKELKIK